jgi:hypothetical protein
VIVSMVMRETRAAIMRRSEVSCGIYLKFPNGSASGDTELQDRMVTG